MALLRLFHRWLGLSLAVVVFAVAASGGLLLFRDAYYRAVHPRLNAPVTAAEVQARGRLLEVIESRWAAEGVRTVKFPEPGLNAFHVWLRDGTEAFVDPGTGHPIDRWHWSDRVPAFLFELHAHLLGKPAGTIVNGAVAIGLLVFGATGLVLWWPGRRGAFRLRHAVPSTLGAAQILRSHAACGALAALPAAVFAATGAGIVFYEPTARVMSRILDVRPPEVADAHVMARPGGTRGWSDILRAVDRTFPEGRTVFYQPGNAENARLVFRKRLPGEWHPNGRSYVVIDPYSGQMVQAIDARAQGAGTRLMHALYPVHAAKVGGLTMTAVAALASAGLAWLAAGGAWSYIARRAAAATRRASSPTFSVPAADPSTLRTSASRSRSTGC